MKHLKKPKNEKIKESSCLLLHAKAFRAVMKAVITLIVNHDLQTSKRKIPTHGDG